MRQGIVLAAGRGSRLAPFSGLIPKPLLPVCNKPIMQYQLEAMRAAGIERVAIVVGPGGDMICDYFGGGDQLGLHVDYILDPAPAGIASSLALAERHVQGPFMVFLGDIFLALGDLGPALAPMVEGAAGSIVIRRDRPEAVRRNFAVIADPDGRVARVVEKPVDPPGDLKGCGIYVFDEVIFEAIRRTPRSPLRNEYEITDAVQILIDMGRPVFAADVVRWDVNVTFPEDLLACNLRVLREQRLDCLIAAGAKISPHAQVRRSIVGDRAVVEADVELEECVVLPSAHVARLSGPVRRHIFADGVMWAGH